MRQPCRFCDGVTQVPEGLRRVQREAPVTPIGDYGVIDAHSRSQRLLPGLAVPSLPYGAAAAITVDELARTRAVLAANGIHPMLDEPSRLVVGPDDALGSALVFHEPGSAPW